MKSDTSSQSHNSLRLLTALAFLITAPLLRAQGFTSTGGVTSTSDSVQIGATLPVQGKLHVFSATDNTVLALYSKNSSTNAVKFQDISVLDPGSQYGVVADFQGNSAIKMGSMRIGFQGYPYIMSLGDGQALQFNSVGVLGFTPGDVVIGGIGLGNGLRVNGSGNSSFVGSVGIGTTSPVRPLSFANAIGEKISLYSNSSTAQDYYGFGVAGAELQYQAPAGTHHSFYLGASEKVRIDGAGNVGIGTPNPVRPLSFANAVGEKLSLFSGSSSAHDYYGFGIAGAELQYQVMAGAHHSFYVGTSEKVRIDGLGNVGIGLTNPQQALSVAGTIQTSVGILFPDGIVQSVAYPFNTGSKTSDLNRNVAGSLTSSVTNTNTGTSGTAVLAAITGNGTATSSRTAYVRLVANETSSPRDWRVGMTDGTGVFKIRDNTGAGTDVMTISGPSARPAITFTGDVTGTTILATYQDLAEWVPAAEPMISGTVVVVGQDSDNTVTASTHAYDTGVAGVVSPNPGLLLGVASASKAKIATTGRVRVRVDATKSPIHKGDLLVTSDRPGMAMKSEPLDVGGVKLHRPGTLIGKALEPLPSGTGEILVLLSLQ
jgi:hypothetical protein